MCSTGFDCMHFPSPVHGGKRFLLFLFRADKLYSFDNGPSICAKCGAKIYLPAQYCGLGMRIAYFSTSALSGITARILCEAWRDSIGPVLNWLSAIFVSLSLMLCIHHFIKIFILSCIPWQIITTADDMQSAKSEFLKFNSLMKAYRFFAFSLGYILIKSEFVTWLVAILSTIIFFWWFKSKKAYFGVLGLFTLMYFCLSIALHRIGLELLSCVDSFVALIAYTIVFFAPKSSSKEQ